MTWDGRLDSRIAAAVVGIQAFKGVEFGMGFEAARRPGSQVHDEIGFDPIAEEHAVAWASSAAPTTPAGWKAA